MVNIVVILVSGGIGRAGSRLRSLEVVSEAGSPLPCTLPLMPTVRFQHSQSGLLSCGGGETDTSATTCDSFTDGAWTQQSHILR